MTVAAVDLLPTDRPLQLIGPDGATAGNAELTMPAPEQLLALYAAMVTGRRVNTQATTLTRQGRLAVYPSSTGQEACQVGSALALRAGDWLFPTYRDSVAVISRGVPASEVLGSLRGDAHCAYDPNAHRVAPQCTPLATNTLHAVGFAQAAMYKGEDTVTAVLLGDGATSEGDTHEALNFAGVTGAPTVFLVQNNGYAISVPLAKQTAAPSLAHKGIGYGVRSRLVDGNDVAAVFAVMGEAVQDAAAGRGPTLIEALTYRIDSHTNADDATRYRDQQEVARWLARDPITRLERHLRDAGLLDDAAVAEAAARADAVAAAMREQLSVDVEPDPRALFRHVYATPTPALRAQQDLLLAELAEQPDPADGGTR